MPQFKAYSVSELKTKAGAASVLFGSPRLWASAGDWKIENGEELWLTQAQEIAKIGRIWVSLKSDSYPEKIRPIGSRAHFIIDV